MIEINLNALQKGETRVSVKGHQTKSGYVKPHIRVVKTTAQAETDAKLAALEVYKEASRNTDDWVKDNPKRYMEFGNVDAYTIDTYDEINSALRDDFTDKELSEIDLKDQIDSISSFLKDAPKFDGVVYRCMHFDVDNYGKDDYDDFIKNVTVDEEIELKPFTSTSFDKDVAMKFTYKKDTNIIMKIKSKRGVVLDGVSSFGEQEVLFDKRSHFKVISREQIDNNINIELEEI